MIVVVLVFTLSVVATMHHAPDSFLCSDHTQTGGAMLVMPWFLCVVIKPLWHSSLIRGMCILLGSAIMQALPTHFVVCIAWICV